MRPKTKLLNEDDTHATDEDMLTAKGMSVNNRNSHNTLTKKEIIKQNLCHCAWVFLGFFLFFGCIQITWAPAYLEHIVHDGIKDALIFTEPRPDDTDYQSWITNEQGPEDSIPLNIFVSFFNVTNPEAILRGELPKFKRSPPICYVEWYHRENISFSEDGTKVRSYFKAKYVFDPDKSHIKETDNFTIIQPAIAALNQFYDSTPDKSEIPFDALFRDLDQDPNELYTSGTARQLIFSMVEIKFPLANIDYSYGMLKNNSGSWYITHTGNGDEYRMGEVLKWSDQDQYGWDENEQKHGQTLLNFDENNHNYTANDCWDPPVLYSPSHFIYQGVWAIKDDPKRNMPAFFVASLKKAWIFDYYKANHYHGIPTEQYNFSLGIQFLNATLYPPNAQFNQFGPSGVFNLTQCFDDFPMFLSLPNFLGAPDYAKTNKEYGLDEPNPIDDMPFFQVEPMTGAILNADVPCQSNIPISAIPPYGNVNTTNNLSLTYLKSFMAPTYLLKFDAHLPEKAAKALQKKTELMNGLDSAFHYWGYASMSLFVLYWSYTWYWYGKNGYQNMFPALCCKK